MKFRARFGYVAGLLAATSLLAEGDATTQKKVRINLDETPTAPQPAPAKNAAKPAKAPTAPRSNTDAKPVAPNKSDAKKGEAKKAEPKRDEEERKVDGFAVSRGERGYLGIKVDGGFRIGFYDREKKPIAPDVDRIALRWSVNYQPNDERALLTPSSDGKTLASDKVVRPPLRFKLYLTLLKGDPGTEAPGETYIVDFVQGG